MSTAAVPAIISQPELAFDTQTGCQLEAYGVVGHDYVSGTADILTFFATAVANDLKARFDDFPRTARKAAFSCQKLKFLFKH
jgi:hypothetical protein